jgi:hypothetical protein
MHRVDHAAHKRICAGVQALQRGARYLHSVSYNI